MAQSSNRIEPLGVTKPAEKSRCCKLTLKECLTLLIGTTIPVVVAIYTAVTNEQIQKSAQFAADEQQRIASERRAFDLKQAAELYQQQLNQNFLDDMYTLQKDGQLNDSANPWVFANARYRAGHRVWDANRKAQVLQFLKERQLIGRQNCTTGCEIKNIKDIVRLNGLDFDYVNLSSQTGSLSQLDLSCIEFDQVSMTNAIFSSVNMNGVTFSDSRLNGVKFSHVSLKCATFKNTKLDEADFGDSNLDRALFTNVNLSTSKLTSTQINQSIFQNVILSNGTAYTSETTKIPLITAETIQTSATSSRSTKSIPKTCLDTEWTPTGVTVAGDQVYGNALNQLYRPVSLYVDDDQTVLIADNNNDRIVAWKLNATSGEVVAGGNGPGNRTDQLNRPRSVIVGERIESLIICDQGNARVMRWPRRSKSGEMIIPDIPCVGLAMDDQNFLYVPVSIYGGNHEVRRYRIGETTGTVVAGGYPGDRLNQLLTPTQVFVDRAHSVYVLEAGNKRVTKWDKNANVGIVVAGFQGAGVLTQLHNPSSVFVDPLGTVYVADAQSNTVIRWCKGDIEGHNIWGESSGGQQARLSQPSDLSIDRRGYLYIADTGYHRIQRFSIEVN